ncbi:hypothetical protein QYF36_022022 [Acer negundo]|nr:hypothetical protein QYF36_022022 [Acer negundo]
MSNYLRSFVPESKKAKKYFAGIENLVMKFEEDGANLLSKKLFKMKYDGQGNVRLHILEMCSIASRLEDVGRKFDDELFLLLVIESLPQQFDNFKVVARTKDWELDEFISRCAVFETSIQMDDMSGSVGQNERVRCFSCGMDGHHWKNCTKCVSGIKMA